jgi:hypothetical protein
MQTLFNSYYGPKVGISIDPTWRYVRSGLLRNVQQTINYYRNKNFSVRNSHLLVRLLNSSETTIGGEIGLFYNQAQAKALRLASIFDLTTSVSRGSVHEGVFFGKGSKEIIMVSDDYRDPIELEANWKNIQAIRFLDHPKSDTSLLLANGKAYSTEEGITVVDINLPALLVQYRCWRKEQKIQDELGFPTETNGMFVHKYVLPNMLYSQLEIAIFNRINNYALGAPMGEPLYRHAFELISYTSKLDTVLKTAIKYLRNKDLDFYAMMRYVPMTSHENLLDIAYLPENAPTVQIYWAEFASRLKLINFLVQISPSNCTKISRQEINALKKIFDRVVNGNILEKIGDKYVIRELESMMLDIRLTTKM